MNDPMRIQYRELSPAEKAQMDELKDRARDLYVFLETINGGREVALAKTKLEEMVMWATKGITS